MIEAKITPVYYHDCPALGPNTRIPRAVCLDNTSTIVICYRHKCPFCSATAGEIEYAKGVTPNADGISYSVNIDLAEKVG